VVSCFRLSAPGLRRGRSQRSAARSLNSERQCVTTAGSTPYSSALSIVVQPGLGPKDKNQMALYKYGTHLYQSNNAEFDKDYEPGSTTSWSGIYRCAGCGREVVHTIGKPLPPQNHHQHTSYQGKIRWKVIVTDSPDPS
jgi:hypothetical protein